MMSEAHPLEPNRAVPGGRVEMFAIRDGDYSGGWFYRFQFYCPGEGELLRYDDELGWHHRHVRFGDDTEIEFHGIVPHAAQFLNETAELAPTETTND